MAGKFIEGVSKVLSGVYSLIKAAVTSASQGSRGVVAYPFAANWGPVNKLVAVSNEPEFRAVYNAAGDVALSVYKILVHAFKGKPSRVLAYRAATSAAAYGAVSLSVGWNLRTAYESDRAFTAIVKPGKAEGATAVQIVEGGVLLMDVEDTTGAGLAAKINASGIVVVTTQGAAVPAATAGVPFAGGNNGGALTSSEYTGFFTEVEADGRANAVALDGVTDDATLTVAETWTKRVRDEGLYITLVRGGPSTWDGDLSLANVKSKTLNHRGIINVGNGCDGYTAAEMAIFVAAYVASIPLNQGVTDQVVDYGKVNNKTQTTLGNRTAAKESGTLIFVMEGDQVVIDEGVNTLTTPPAGERTEFGKIRVNNTLDAIVKDLEAFGLAYKRNASNTDAARRTFAATVEESYFKPLVRLEVIQPGFSYAPDPDYYGKGASMTPKIDEAFFYSEFQPVDSMEKIYQKFGVKF